MAPITGRDDEFRGTITALFQQELGHPPNADQLAAYVTWCEAGATGEQIQQRLHDEPEAVAYRTKPVPLPTPILPDLTTSGIDFMANGQRVVLKGTDQFLALRMMLDGQDLTPLIQESQELGFDMWRVFATGSRAQNGSLELRPTEGGYYEAMGQLGATLHSAGIRLLLCAHVDNQDVKAPADHWGRCADALRPFGALLSGGNEWSKNGFDPAALSVPSDILWSRGSDVEDRLPVAGVGSFMEFHPRRLWPTIMLDSVASPVEIYKHRPLVPLVIDEPARMGSEGSGAEYADPRNCWRFARHYATEAAGAVFHSRAGQRGQVMDPQTRACAEAWQKGMGV
jgi:hypothetical protein